MREKRESKWTTMSTRFGKGFTLIELLIVVAIIAILAAQVRGPIRCKLDLSICDVA